jgi:signal transduction histidine kinase/streptogramin lyase
MLGVVQCLSGQAAHSFIHYGVEEGLPSSKVYKLYQDGFGYLWFGTEAGLSRFDGYDFKNFTIKDGLPDNDVLNIQEDSLGRIWITTMKQPCYYDRNTGGFVRPPIFDQMPGPTPTTFGVSQDGTLWLAYSLDKILKISPDLNTIENLAPSLNQNISDTRSLFAFMTDSRGDVYFVNRDILWDISKNVKYDLSQVQINRIGPNYVTVSRVGDAILVSHHGKLVRIDTRTGKADALSTNFEGTFRDRYLLDKNGNQWAAIPRVGVGRFTMEGSRLFGSDFRLKGVVISEVIEDGDGNIWLSSLGNGVYCLPNSASSIKSIDLGNPEGDNIMSLLSSPNGNMIAGTGAGDIAYVKENGAFTKNTTYRLGNVINRITSLGQTSDGTLVIGCDKGIILDRRDGSTALCPVIGSVKDLKIYNDSIFLATSSNAYLLSINDLPKIDQIDSSNIIIPGRQYAVYRDAQHNYWVGTTDGLRKRQGNSIQYFGGINDFYKFSIKDINEDQNGLIWLATQGAGLVVFDKNKPESLLVLNADNGFVADICNDLLIDNDTIWVASNRGLSRITNFDFQNASYDVITLDKTDGLFSSEVNKLATLDGKIWVGTSLGLSVMAPNKLKKTNRIPNIYITELKINEQSFPLGNSYHANYHDNLEVQFVGISFESQKKLNYRFKMVGIDKDWQHTQSRTVRYASMPSGNYVFEVYAADKFGNENPVPATFTLHVMPPFWQRWWFYMLAITALGVSMWGGYKVLRTYANKRELEKLVSLRTHELNENVRALKRSNKDLEQYAYIASHDLRAPLRSMTGLMQMLEDKANHKFDDEEREFVQLSIDAAKRMNIIIEDLLVYSQLNNAPRKLATVNLDVVVRKIKRDLGAFASQHRPEIRLETTLPNVLSTETSMFQLFQNLIENGLKYNESEQPIVWIGHRELPDGKAYEFCVRDNGIGIDPAFHSKVFVIFQRLHHRGEYSGTGIGLAICKKIVEAQGGKIWFKSEPGKGASFFFTLKRPAP